MIKFKYGMSSRPFSIGCQPKGAIDVLEADRLKDGFYDIVVYDHKLTDKEISDFELKEIE